MSGSFSVLTLRGGTWTVWLTDPGRGRVNPPPGPPPSWPGGGESPCCPLMDAAASCTRSRVGTGWGTTEPSATGRTPQTSALDKAARGPGPPEASSGPFLPRPGLLFLAFQPGLSAIASPKYGAPRASNYPLSPPCWSRGRGSPAIGADPALGLPAGTLLPAVTAPQGVGAAQVHRFPGELLQVFVGEVSLSYLHSDGALASLWDKMQIHPLRSPPQWRAFSALYCGLSFGDPRGWVRSGLAVEIVGG